MPNICAPANLVRVWVRVRVRVRIRASQNGAEKQTQG